MDHQKQIIAESIDYLVAHYNEQPSLDMLASRAGYEATHFQKLFKAHIGISPKRIVQYMNTRHAKMLLGEGYSVLNAALETGLSGTGRLHDVFVCCEGASPGEIKNKGKGLEIHFGFHPGPLGDMLIATTKRGVCYLGFVIDQDKQEPIEKMKKHLPEAVYIKDEQNTLPLAQEILQVWQGEEKKGSKLTLDLYGTNLQIKVWQALLEIPCGKTRTYQQIGTQIGKPKAARAIGNAVGANPVSLLIPCHRVIRSTGIIDNYAWGSARKKLILGLEAERAH